MQMQPRLTRNSNSNSKLPEEYKMAMKLIVLAATLAVALSAPSRKSRDLERFNCQKNMLTQLDNYLNEIQLFSGKRKFPETIPDLKEACKQNKNVLGLIDKMTNKCMVGFVKNVMQVTLYSIRKSQKALCRSRPNKDMQNFVNAGKCVNKGRELFKTCLRDTANNILASKNADISKKLPIICCEIVRARQCLMTQAKKVPECTEENVDILQNRFNSISLNSINIACGDYNDETDRCSRVEVPKLGDDVFTKLKKERSLAFTLLEFIESFPEDELLTATSR